MSKFSEGVISLFDIEWQHFGKDNYAFGVQLLSYDGKDMTAPRDLFGIHYRKGIGMHLDLLWLHIF